MPSVYWMGLSSILMDLCLCLLCLVQDDVPGSPDLCELWGQASLLKDGLNFGQPEAHPS